MTKEKKKHQSNGMIREVIKVKCKSEKLGWCVKKAGERLTLHKTALESDVPEMLLALQPFSKFVYIHLT